MASVGANLVHFFLQGLVLLGVLAAVRYDIDFSYIWLIVPALVVLLLLSAALAVFLAAVNVYARDAQHLLELVLLAWFWMTPIVYQWALPAQKLAGRGWPTWLALLNPITSITLSFQRAIYGVTSFTDGAGNTVLILPQENQLWYLRNLGLVGFISVLLLIGAVRLFGRLEANFAEEL